MAFFKKIWTDRQSEYPARRKLTETGTPDVYDVSREEGLIVQEGDSLSAANLNDLENRIDASIAGVESKADLALPAIQKGAANGVASLDANTKVAPTQASARIVNVTANKTLSIGDAGTVQRVNSSSGVTVTVPANASVAFPVGTEIEVYRAGSGAVTIGASGVTVECAIVQRGVADRYTSIVLKKWATDTWSIQGNVG